jgi:hypothetical protein
MLAHKYSTETETEFNADRILDKAPIVNAPVVNAPVVNAPVVNASVVNAPVVNAPVVEPIKYLLTPITSENSTSHSKIGGTSLTETTTDISDSPTSVSDKYIQKGGRELSPGMKVFQDICKFISLTLEIPNGTIVKKIGGQLQRDVKEKDKDISADKLLDAVKKEFKQNKNKYELLKNKYIKEKDDKKKAK